MVLTRVEARSHASNEYVLVVEVPSVDLLNELWEELVEAALTDPDLCPRIAGGRLSFPVLHHHDARLAANISAGGPGTLGRIEGGVDELFEQRRECGTRR
jgi:hypothetical protein